MMPRRGEMGVGFGPVSGELFLVGFEEVSAPGVVQVRGDAFPAVQLWDVLLVSEALEDDPDLSLREELPVGASTDLSYCCFS